MKQFLISEYFTVKDNSDHATIKQKFEQRLGQLFKIHDLKENVDGHIAFKALSGSQSSCFHHAQMQVDCDVILEDNVLRIMATGEVRVAPSKVFLYVLALISVILFILWHNSSWLTVGPFDAVLFLIVAGYIVYDKDVKVQGAENLMQDVIGSIEAEFAA